MIAYRSAREMGRWMLIGALTVAIGCNDPIQPASGGPLLGTAPALSGDALVLYVPFDETAGTVAADASGLGHVVTLKKAAVFDPHGFFEGAMRVESTGGYALVSDSPMLNQAVTTARTVSLWFRAQDVGVSSRKQILWLEGDGTIGLAAYLHLGRLYVAGWNTTTAMGWKGTYLWTAAVQSGRYHHVALVLTGGPTPAANGLRGFLDGVPFGIGIGAELAPHASTSIGASDGSVRFHDGKVTGTHGLGGRIDDVRVYNRALSETEIQALAERGANRAPVTLAGPDVTVHPETTMVLDGSASWDRDNGPAPLSFRWEQVAGTPVAIGDPTSAVTSVTLDVGDTYTFRLTTSDGELESSDEMTIVAVNRPPVPAAGPNGWNYVGVPVGLDGTGSFDPDGWPAPLSYYWEQVSGPTVTIADPTSAVTSVTMGAAGTHVLRLTVSDGQLQASDEVSLVGRVFVPGAANPVAGTSLTGFRYGEWEGKNQRRSWWNSRQQRWDAVMPASVPPGSVSSQWWLVAGAEGITPRYTVAVAPPGTSLSSPYTPDAFWDDAAGMLYVLLGHRSSTIIKTYAYDLPTDSYRLIVNGAKVAGMGGFATVYRTPNGYLWTSTMGTGASPGLWINRSRDGGATWDGAVNIVMPNSSGQTSLTHFSRNGTTYVAVAGAEDGRVSNSRFRFHYIDQNSAAWNTTSGWTNESGAMPPFQGTEHADDELSVIRDDANNIYIAAETELGSYGDPQLFLYKRTVDGQWSQFTIRRRVSGVRYRKRPTVAIDGSTGRIYVFSLHLDKIELSYASAPLSDLGQLTDAPMSVVFQEPGSAFRNNFVPRFPTTAESGMLVLIDNLVDGIIWGRRLP